MQVLMAPPTEPARSALAAFPTLTAFLAGGAGGGGLRHRRTLLVPALFTGLLAVRAGERAAGERNGGEKQGNAFARHFGDQSRQGNSRIATLLLSQEVTICCDKSHECDFRSITTPAQTHHDTRRWHQWSSQGEPRESSERTADHICGCQVESKSRGCAETTASTEALFPVLHLQPRNGCAMQPAANGQRP